MEKTIIVAAKDTPKEKIKFAISSIEELQIEIKRRFDLGNQDTISIFDAEGISVGNFGSISTGDSLLFEITSTNLVKAKKTPLNSEAKKKLLDSLYKICAHIVGKGEKRCRIVLLGASGAGKSSTINSLFGKEVLTTSDKAACTTIPIAKEVRVANTDLILELIDTPGLKDEYGRDDEFISLIQQFLSGKEIDCVLYVHDMAKTRFDSTDFEVVKKLDTALGTKIWNNVIVVLTRANAVDSFPKPDDITIADWHATPKIDKWNSYSKTCKANVRNKFRQILGSNSDVRIALVDNITFERDSNGNSLLVDGTMWKEKLVTKVLETMDALGALTLAPQLINSPDEEIVVPAVKHTKTLLQRLKTVFSFLQEIPPVIKSAWDFIVDLKKYFK